MRVSQVICILKTKDIKESIHGYGKPGKPTEKQNFLYEKLNSSVWHFLFGHLGKTDTVHKVHDKTTWNQKLFVGKQN